MKKSAIYCEHANEMPQSCPCPADCYCKEHACRSRGAPSPRTGSLRIAFCGASGTGKTTLATWLVETLGIPFNPVGSRSVSKAMGFDSPYDVDKAGRRAEFQRRLVTEKRTWENEHTSFVTDRTTLDNLAYTVFHDIATIDAALLDQVVGGMYRYTHVIYCPVGVFCNPAGDPNRVHDMTYHKLYDTMIEALVQRHLPMSSVKFGRCAEAGQNSRRVWLEDFLGI
jgi:hypothetical protein